MQLRIKKRAIYAILLLVTFVLYIWWRHPTEMKISGKTMGTTYHITYFDQRGRDFKPQIDSLLIRVNHSINTYDSSSEISRFNRARAFRFELPHFLPALQVAQEVYEASSGAFDPTVAPLVNLWGFGWKKREHPDVAKIDSIMALVGMDKVAFNADSVWKTDTRVQIGFGGIGQGYGADVVAGFLREKGIDHMLVELGGEGMAIGKNLSANSDWKIGILDPRSKPDSLFFLATVSLFNQSFTTSGNYFNYRVIDGRKYAHSIDPQTGYPVNRALLSASVFTNDCTTADAWGTAFMVMGHEKAITYLNERPEMDALLIYTLETGEMKTFVTPKLKIMTEMIDHDL